MNIHARIPTTPAEPKNDVRLLELEDTVNTALNAALMVHDYVEDWINRVAHNTRRDEGNTLSYAIGHVRNTMRAAHDHFHEYLQQEFAQDRERALAFGEPDPAVCPSWKGAGVYRFDCIPEHEFLSVSWNREHQWFSLVVPATGERVMALCAWLWEERVDGIVTDAAVLAKAVAA